MSSAAKAHEPSMEEILASIRRIISDDDPQSARPASKPPLRPERDLSEPDLGQDDIDEMFAAMDTAQAPAPSPKPAVALRSAPVVAEPLAPVELEDDLDVLELTEELEDPAPTATPVAPARPEPLRAPPARPAAQDADPTASPDRLLSSDADDAVSNAFGSLAHTILAGNARTLDDVVREMLRPMLRAWLDDNLPPLVERLVRHEIERVARGGR